MSDSGRGCCLWWEVKGSPSCLGFHFPLHPGSSSWKPSQITSGSSSYPAPTPPPATPKFWFLRLIPLLQRPLSSYEPHSSFIAHFTPMPARPSDSRPSAGPGSKSRQTLPSWDSLLLLPSASLPGPASACLHVAAWSCLAQVPFPAKSAHLRSGPGSLGPPGGSTSPALHTAPPPRQCRMKLCPRSWSACSSNSPRPSYPCSSSGFSASTTPGSRCGFSSTTT